MSQNNNAQTSGAGASGFDSDDEEHYSGGAENSKDLDADEEWSLELITEALKNVAKPDRLSAYERRVALREMKDLIQSVLDSTDGTPEGPLVTKYLTMSEHTDTQKQLIVLKKEMTRLLTMTQQLDGLRSELCVKIKTLWEKAEHNASDVLEVKIRNGGKGIPATSHSIAVLQAIHDVWAGVFKPVSLSDGIGRLTMMLEGCYVPADVKSQIVKLSAASPPDLYCACERLSASLTDYGLILAKLNKLGRPPSPKKKGVATTGGAWTGEESEGGGDSSQQQHKKMFDSDFMAEDDYREEMVKLEEQCRRWETMSGVPFYASIGSHHLLKSKKASDPIVEVLKSYLREANSAGVQ